MARKMVPTAGSLASSRVISGHLGSSRLISAHLGSSRLISAQEEGAYRKLPRRPFGSRDRVGPPLGKVAPLVTPASRKRVTACANDLTYLQPPRFASPHPSPSRTCIPTRGRRTERVHAATPSPKLAAKGGRALPSAGEEEEDEEEGPGLAAGWAAGGRRSSSASRGGGGGARPASSAGDRSNEALCSGAGGGRVSGGRAACRAATPAEVLTEHSGMRRSRAGRSGLRAPRLQRAREAGREARAGREEVLRERAPVLEPRDARGPLVGHLGESCFFVWACPEVLLPRDVRASHASRN